MNSSTFASSLPPARFARLYFGSVLTCVLAAVCLGQWAMHRFELTRRISPMHYQLGLVTAAGPSVNTLAIGDSHAALDFRPSDAGTMNAAFPGENIDDMRLKLRYLVPRLPNLKRVLLQAQPHMFFPHRDRPVSAQYRYLLAGGPVFHPLERWWSQFDPCCRARVPSEALLAARGKEPHTFVPDIHANGFVDYTRYPPYDRARFPQLAAAEVASYGGRAPVDRLVFEYEAIIGDLTRSGIEVVLARYPLSRSLWDAMGDPAMQAAEAQIRSIAERHHLRTCGSWAPLPDDMHLNPDHLNPAGALRYTPTLERCAAQR